MSSLSKTIDNCDTNNETIPLSGEAVKSQSALPGLSRDNTSKVLLRFIDSDDKPPSMKMEFKNMQAKVPITPKSKELKTILDNVSGTVYPGELVALMGPRYSQIYINIILL